MNTLHDAPPGPEEIEALLPWHAAGTLSRRDRARVEEALARDPELARRYELVREELGAAIQVNESLGAPSTRTMQQLMSAIDAEPAARRPPAAHDLRTRFAVFLSTLSPRTLAWSASAAMLAIVLQAGLLTGLWINERGTERYETASHRQRAAEPGTFALVRFAPQAGAAEIARLLEENKISVVDGPKPGGLYRIRVADARLSKEELDRIISRMQQDKIIAFAAPAE